MPSGQFLIEIPTGLLIRVLIETVVSAGLMLWCVSMRRDGSWAIVGAVAAACWTATAGLFLVAYVLTRRSSFDLYTWTTDHGSALDWIRVSGMAIAVIAVTFGRAARASASS